MQTPQAPTPKIKTAAGLSALANPKRSDDTPPMKPPKIRKQPVNSGPVNVAGHGAVNQKALEAYLPRMMDLQEFTKPMQAMHAFRHEANQGGSASQQLYNALRNE